MITTKMIGITPSVKVYNGENNYVGDVTGRGICTKRNIC